jgi:hypothetical protein
MLKVAFLFLTIGPLFHENYWNNFFAGNKERYTIYAHAKYPKEAGFLRPHLIPVLVPTRWQHTMKAQIELLRYALKNPDNTKFIFLSESTIPLRSFDVVYRTLLSHENSQFNFRLNPHHDPRRLVDGVPASKQYKHTQWIVLNRKHAQILIDHADHLGRPVFCDNEHYPGSILANLNLLHEIVKKNTTYVCWSHKGPNGHYPFTFTDFTRAVEHQLLQEAFKRNYLFMRKIGRSCDLKKIEHLLPYKTT